jgi:putative membrane protein
VAGGTGTLTAEPLSGRFIRAACRLLVRRLDLRVEGREHIPRTGPVVIAARHYHHLWDGCGLIAVSPRPLHVVVTLDWMHQPVGRRLMDVACRAAGWPVVPRPDSPSRAGSRSGDAPRAADVPRLLAATRQSVQYLRAGEALLIFPEGYPNVDPGYTPKADDEDFLPFRPGFARFAALAELGGVSVPIIPAGLEYRRGRRWRVTIRLGAPIWIGADRDIGAWAKSVEVAVRRLSGIADSG